MTGPELLYLANARIPSEKAHPYQIVQMCEAFAEAGAQVTLLYAYRHSPDPALRTRDIWGHYGVKRIFRAERLPALDLYPLARPLPGNLQGRAEQAAAAIQTATYQAALIGRVAARRDALLYSRDATTLRLLAALWPHRARRMFYEAHTYPATAAGIAIRRWLAERIGGFVVITDHLRQRYEALGVPPERLLVAHDGFRAERFAITGDRAAWRERLGWPRDAFIVGYAGRFYSGLEGMDKGIDTLAEAAIRLVDEGGTHPVRLALVGGPASYVDGLRTRLQGTGLPDDFILYPGMVAVDDVPGCLRAFDVCTIPSPWNEFFAYYTSPMKLFEYMASGTPLVASDLPSTAEIITDGVNGLLIPPGDAEALAGALRRLRDDPALGERLAAQALQDVQKHTWTARARRILSLMGDVGALT